MSTPTGCPQLTSVRPPCDRSWLANKFRKKTQQITTKEKFVIFFSGTVCHRRDCLFCWHPLPPSLLKRLLEGERGGAVT